MIAFVLVVVFGALMVIFFVAARQLMCWLGELEDLVEYAVEGHHEWHGSTWDVNWSGMIALANWERRTPPFLRGRLRERRS